MIAIAALTLALVLVPCCGGHYRPLLSLRLRSEFGLLLLFVLQGVARGRFGASVTLGEWSVVAWGVACVALLALLAGNRRLVGVPVIALGVAANLLVVLANSGMPHVGSAPIADATGFYVQHNAGRLAAFLGDVLPLPGGWVLSLGDLLLLVGVVTFVLSQAARNDETDSAAGILSDEAK